MVASECEPWAKTGGLADVVDALSRALGRLGHEVDVYLPHYRGVEVPASAERLPLDDMTVLTARADGYRIRLVEHGPSFDRAGLYGDADGDFPDNGARFARLGAAALATMAAERRPAEILHGHDWQAGPALLALHHRYRSREPFRRTASVLTCHNLAYHGWVPRERTGALGLPERVGSADGVDLLREAVATADLVNTVSPTYARESLSREYGAGLDDVLRARGDRYLGILNGIDPELWNPAADPALAAPFSADDPAGKERCRADLCDRHTLDPDGPVLGLVGRLDPQKGFDLLAGAAPALLEAGARIVVLGSGDHRLIEELAGVAARAPDRVALVERFDRDEARRIYAGSDVFLMPSRFEPCGQGQMIALRYGTVPLVRSTGGLADTIVDVDHDPDGNGFVFRAAQPGALAEAARRAIRAWRDRDRWDALVRRGMREDFGWSASAGRYVEAYERAVELAAGAA